MIIELNFFFQIQKKLIYSEIISEETKNWLVPYSKEPVNFYL